jgi:hypothetical protein
LAAALKLQFQRHCFIQIRQQETQPMLVPFVEPVTTFTYNRSMLDYYVMRQHEKQQPLPATEVDAHLAKQENALLSAATPQGSMQSEPAREPITLEASASPAMHASTPIWNRVSSPDTSEGLLSASARKRGPKPDRENHEKVIKIIKAYGESWTTDENLLDICEEFDREKIPAPKTWAARRDGVAHTWSRGRHHYQHLVIKAIKDRLKAATGEP